MTINRTRLLTDEQTWLPEGNVLTESQMLAINELVISNQIPADDSAYYPEALCKGLKAIAVANQAKFQVDLKGLKKDKSGSVELEYFEKTSSDPWGDFIKSLTDLCPIFGYTGLNQGTGMRINPGDAFKITDEANVSNLVELDISCPSVGLTGSSDLTL